MLFFLSHMNTCTLFNAKSSLYIYSKYIWFSWVGFYGITTIVAYLMPNPVNRYILNICKSTSLMSLSLLLQQCPACLVCLTWIVFVIGGRWPYSWCLVGCCRQDLFKIARSILVSLPSSFFSSHFVRVHVVHPYSSIDVMYSYGPPHMAEQKQDDQHEHTFSNYVRIRDVVQKTCQRRYTIGKSGEWGSGISVLPARHDDDDEIYVLCKYMYFVDNIFRQVRAHLFAHS